MIIIGIRKKPLKFIICIILAVSVGFNIYGYAQNLRLTSKYKSLLFISNHIEQYYMSSSLLTGFSPSSYKTVEIFDISKGQVIKKVSSNSFIENEAKGYLLRITGMYVKANALPDKGYIIKIPLKKPITVENQWLNDYDTDPVKEIFVLIPASGNPYLLVMDNMNRPLFYNFEGNTGRLLASLSFNPHEI
ncbi:hypothetical protein DFR58_108124 [Anaerobacterium chartisolvens]|uniref:Uncharacterized protein n=1 Tax=Anaerobacterium chartisolvens TaxID=1297424 RepID=A0A369B6T8_9FIRM|nr:hypothetical protein [Anaerobacterium chartisolvens]RCX17229.1 hypothetical protein DFR58_108124 [Anaerobacterium chartisolvens]